MTPFAVESGVNRLRDQIVDAAERGAPLRIRGGGTWLDAGRPVDSTGTISVAEHSGIVAYVPGDLTMTVRGGTTLGEIRDATAQHNQWLALDPAGSDDGTIGATTVTASAGPLATFFGTPRDLVLGVEFVTGAGSVARGGGRVVKNVAGFDLTRLMIGSWGTLGVVTEVTVRLHARPQSDRSFAIAIGEGEIGRVRRLLRALPFKPYACEVVNASLAQTLFGNKRPAVLLRLAGNTDGVTAERETFNQIGVSTEIDSNVWSKLRAIEPPNAGVVRLSDVPSEIERTWLTASLLDAYVHASPARGIVRIIAHDSTKLSAINGVSATRIAERLGSDQWVDFAPPASALNARIKQTFDPSNVLNRGILGVSA
ncbi:MAG TPA: FAD-binding protein [Gemmatimonadaceae bacterium]